MKKIIWQLLNVLRLGAPIQLTIAGYLRDKGWMQSFYSKRSVDAAGKPLPWLTYPLIDFLAPRLNKSMDVFEFGAGNSTHWFAEKVAQVHAVEHENEWVKILISQGLPANAQLHLRPLNEGYASLVAELSIDFDIILIDGRMRNACTKHAVKALKPNGVIIFDNSDRLDYDESYAFLIENDFKRIDFWGISPITPITTCTSVFYRKHNVLAI